jgi:hypothetical protein
MRHTSKNDFPDEPPDQIGEAEASRFDNLKTLAYGGIIAVATLTISLNDFVKMWTLPSTPIETAFFVARIILFAELVILAARWIFATHDEMEMWRRWLDNPLATKEIYVGMFSLSVVLGLSVAFPHKIGFLSGFLTISFLFDYWTGWLANDHFERALQRTRAKSMSNTKRDVLRVMEYYWLKRPQLARVTTMMFFASLSFSFALAGFVLNEPNQESKSQGFQLAAYAVLILDILIGEIVITWWRHKRDQDIDLIKSRR